MFNTAAEPTVRAELAMVLVALGADVVLFGGVGVYRKDRTTRGIRARWIAGPGHGALHQQL